MAQAILQRSKQRIVLDVLVVALIFISGTLFLYLGVYVDQQISLAVKGLIGFCLMLFGLVGSAMFVGYDLDRLFDFNDLLNNANWTMIALVGVGIANQGVAQVTSMAVVPVSGTLFVLMMAVAEECFFRAFLLTSFVKMSGNELLAIIGSSLIGAIYHIAVYGTSDALIAMVLLGFIVLGASYVASGYRLSVPMGAHVIINLLSSTGVA